jgi:hypothetical protein
MHGVAHGEVTSCVTPCGDNVYSAVTYSDVRWVEAYAKINWIARPAPAHPFECKL